MDKFQLDDMIRGWFVGDFTPSVVRRDDFEVAIQRYKAGDKEKDHCHKVATEITVIASGTASINGEVFEEGTILKINPGEYSQFTAITDVTTVVVKFPSVMGDKYIRTKE